MPIVTNVLSHWTELYSARIDDVEYGDHLFYFGFKNPQDILVTTSLSSATVGVDLDRRFVGSIGARVHRYFHFDSKGVLQYKELPPSYEWNSEYINRCVSVAVRTAVHYASGTSLANVYVFQRPALADKAREKVSIKTVAAVSLGTRKASHRTTVSGAAEVLKSEWGSIERDIRKQSAALLGARRVSVEVRNGGLPKVRRRPPLGMAIPVSGRPVTAS